MHITKYTKSNKLIAKCLKVEMGMSLVSPENGSLYGTLKQTGHVLGPNCFEVEN